MNKNYVQCFDILNTLNQFYSLSKQCLFLKIEKKIVRQGVKCHPLEQLKYRYSTEKPRSNFRGSFSRDVEKCQSK